MMKRCHQLSSKDDETEITTKLKKKKKNKPKKADPATSPPPSAPGRAYTLSVALPGSIIGNAQTAELRTYLAGQVARALVIFNVDEVVVFDEQVPSVGTGTGQGHRHNKHHGNPNLFLGRLLHYLETPQYLRKSLFPMHSDLKYVGMLNPLDCPHHMRQDKVSPYREGVVLDTPGTETSSSVDCGLAQAVQVDKQLKPGIRVTVAIHHTKKTGLRGRVVPPSTPRREGGLYWGYRVRMAQTLGTVFTESPFEGGYDLTLGTSDKGESVDTLKSLPPFRHALVVLGGVQGLEHALSCDCSLHVKDVSLLFHHYLNVCPNQGSGTIRTEEALLVVLSSLRPLLTSANQST